MKKEKVPKGPGCVETLSSGLDLNARDARGINADINVSSHSPDSYRHRVHRVATAAFWRTFSHEGKISPGW